MHGPLTDSFSACRFIDPLAPWQVLSTVTYFLLIAWKARVTKRKVVELKAVSTYDQASAEVVSKFRADSFKARGFWHLGTHKLTAAGVQGSSVTRACAAVAQARKLTDEFSEGKTRANSVAYLLALTMGFKALSIGYNLSVGPIFLVYEFNQDVSIVGILFAAGAGFGTITAVTATLTKPGKWFFDKYLPVLAAPTTT